MKTIYDNEETLPKIKNDLQDDNDILKNIRDSVYTAEKIDPYTMLGKLNQILKIKKGDKGDTGARGIGIVAVDLTQEGGLDFTLSNGEHLYTASVKGDTGDTGAQGIGIVAVDLTQEGGLDFTLSNGEHLYTASVKGEMPNMVNLDISLITDYNNIVDTGVYYSTLPNTLSNCPPNMKSTARYATIYCNISDEYLNTSNNRKFKQISQYIVFTDTDNKQLTAYRCGYIETTNNQFIKTFFDWVTNTKTGYATLNNTYVRDGNIRYYIMGNLAILNVVDLKLNQVSGGNIIASNLPKSRDDTVFIISHYNNNDSPLRVRLAPNSTDLMVHYDETSTSIDNLYGTISYYTE